MPKENQETKQNYEYDFSRPIPIEAIKDEEVRKVFLNFSESIMDIFSFENRNRKTGAEDYSYYVYHIMDMGMATTEATVSEQMRQSMPVIPEKFFDLLLMDEPAESIEKAKALKEAQDECLQIIANYMAMKYKIQTVGVSFDGYYYLDKNNTANLFTQDKVAEGTKIMMLSGSNENGSYVKGVAANIVNAEILTEWMDGATTKDFALWDLSSGEILARYNAETNEKQGNTDHGAMVKKETLKFIDMDFRVSVKNDERTGGTISFVPPEMAIKRYDKTLKELKPIRDHVAQEKRQSQTKTPKPGR